MTEAYPLQWPPSWPRGKYPQWSRFKVSQHEAQNGLLRKLSLLGATHVVISTNIPLRRDGLPYTGRRAPDDQGVAVYFRLNGEDQCIPCDKWRTIAENMRAVELTVSALRGLERWGAKEMVNAAFRGFKALPETVIVTPYTARPWYEVLEVAPSASPDIVKAAYRSKASRAHPDAPGGSVEAFQEVKAAYDQAVGATS